MSKKPSFSRSCYELLSSMRFAVSLLTVLAIASIIGTVLQQGKPYTDYAFEFGQFWFPLFEKLGLYDVYHTGWFLLILCFLVASTSLCIYRNAPLMLREMRSFREHAAESSLKAFAHRADYEFAGAPQPLIQRLTEYLAARGYRSRINERDGALLIAAKAGSWHRLGYIFTHAAIVIICIGALIDSNLPLRFEELTGQKVIETRDIPQSQVPARSRLPASSAAFRGDVNIPEGSSADVIFINSGSGYLVQELPIVIALKKFHITHYDTGQPSSFASDLVIRDKRTGKTSERTIRVNHPLNIDGISIYQASFADGGTHLKIRCWPLFTDNQPFELKGSVNQTNEISTPHGKYRVEFTDFRSFNVQKSIDNPVTSKVDAEAVSQTFFAGAGAAAIDTGNGDLRNVGPSFQYKLRDAQGQATEYNNYMLPLEFGGHWYLLSGVRHQPNQPFRYVRLPLDGGGRIDGYMRLRAALFNTAERPAIAARFVKAALAGDGTQSQTLRERLTESTERVLDIFMADGFVGLANFLEKSVPKKEQKKVAQIYLKILEGAAFQAYDLSLEQAGLADAKLDAATQRFVRDSLNAVSDSFLYGAPVYLQLQGYDQVRASGLQLTRSPGKNIVWLGSLLLVLGVFAMFYIRERRIWLLIKPAAHRVLFAMSANRKTLEFEKEFTERQRDIDHLIRGR
jgi:cytochrome c biogenesis protein